MHRCLQVYLTESDALLGTRNARYLPVTSCYRARAGEGFCCLHPQLLEPQSYLGSPLLNAPLSGFSWECLKSLFKNPEQMFTISGKCTLYCLPLVWNGIVFLPVHAALWCIFALGGNRMGREKWTKGVLHVMKIVTLWFFIVIMWLLGGLYQDSTQFLSAHYHLSHAVQFVLFSWHLQHPLPVQHQPLVPQSQLQYECW